jgi:hypothetical protein
VADTPNAGLPLASEKGPHYFQSRRQLGAVVAVAASEDRCQRNTTAIADQVVFRAIVKVNDWNLYSSSLGLVNAIDVLLGAPCPELG